MENVKKFLSLMIVPILIVLASKMSWDDATVMAHQFRDFILSPMGIMAALVIVILSKGLVRKLIAATLVTTFCLAAISILGMGQQVQALASYIP